MRKYNYSLFVLLNLLVILCACQREVDWNVPGSVQSDSTTLIKLVTLDTTLPSGQDTVNQSRFFYDVQKRITGVDFKDFYLNPPATKTYYQRFYYNGNDTLPYKMTRKNDFDADSSRHYFYYGNGFIVRDSIINFSSGAVSGTTIGSYFQLSLNRYFQRITRYNSSNVIVDDDSLVYTTNLVAGNILNEIDSLWSLTGALPFLTYVTSSISSYDNKSHPLARYNVWYLGYFDNLTDDFVFGRGVNNYLSTTEQELFPFSNTYTYLFSNTYNNLGYPSVMRISGYGNFKVLLFYTKL